MSLTESQREALALLAGVLGPGTYLAGGVAVALRLGHRESRDLDLFTAQSDPVAMAEPLAQLRGVRVTGRAAGTLYLEVGGVPASVIRYRYPQLDPLDHSKGLPFPLASSRDLICMKLAATAARGALRDFWDLHGMLTRQQISLEQALAWYQQKYRSEDVGYVIRSLAYFEDADAEPRPTALTAQHWARIKDDLRRWVRALK